MKERTILGGVSFPVFTCDPTIVFEDLGYKTIPQNSFIAFLLELIWNQDGFLPYSFLLSYVYKVRTKPVQILLFGNFVTRLRKSFKIIE